MSDVNTSAIGDILGRHEESKNTGFLFSDPSKLSQEKLNAIAANALRNNPVQRTPEEEMLFSDKRRVPVYTQQHIVERMYDDGFLSREQKDRYAIARQLSQMNGWDTDWVLDNYDSVARAYFGTERLNEQDNYLKAAKEYGQAMVRRNMLSYQQMMNPGKYQEYEQLIRDVELNMPDFEELRKSLPPGLLGTLEKWTGDVVTQIPQMIGAAGQGLVQGTAMAGGAALMAMAGLATPVIGDGIAGTALTGLATTWGFQAGYFTYNYQMMAGANYRDITSKVLPPGASAEENERVRKVSTAGAIGVGIIGALAENLSFSTAGKLLSPIKDALAKKSLAKILKKLTERGFTNAARTRMFGVAKKALTGIATEEITELAQDSIAMAYEEIMNEFIGNQYVSNDSVLEELNKRGLDRTPQNVESYRRMLRQATASKSTHEIIQQFLETAARTLIVSGFISAPGTIIDLYNTDRAIQIKVDSVITEYAKNGENYTSFQQFQDALLMDPRLKGFEHSASRHMNDIWLDTETERLVNTEVKNILETDPSSSSQLRQLDEEQDRLTKIYEDTYYHPVKSIREMQEYEEQVVEIDIEAAKRQRLEFEENIEKLEKEIKKLGNEENDIVKQSKLMSDINYYEYQIRGLNDRIYQSPAEIKKMNRQERLKHIRNNILAKMGENRESYNRIMNSLRETALASVQTVKSAGKYTALAEEANTVSELIDYAELVDDIDQVALYREYEEFYHAHLEESRKNQEIRDTLRIEDNEPFNYKEHPVSFPWEFPRWLKEKYKDYQPDKIKAITDAIDKKKQKLYIDLKRHDEIFTELNKMKEFLEGHDVASVKRIEKIIKEMTALRDDAIRWSSIKAEPVYIIEEHDEKIEALKRKIHRKELKRASVADKKKMTRSERALEIQKINNIIKDLENKKLKEIILKEDMNYLLRLAASRAKMMEKFRMEYKDRLDRFAYNVYQFDTKEVNEILEGDVLAQDIFTIMEMAKDKAISEVDIKIGLWKAFMTSQEIRFDDLINLENEIAKPLKQGHISYEKFSESDLPEALYPYINYLTSPQMKNIFERFDIWLKTEMEGIDKQWIDRWIYEKEEPIYAGEAVFRLSEMHVEMITKLIRERDKLKRSAGAVHNIVRDYVTNLSDKIHKPITDGIDPEYSAAIERLQSIVGEHKVREETWVTIQKSIEHYLKERKSAERGKRPIDRDADAWADIMKKSILEMPLNYFIQVTPAGEQLKGSAGKMEFQTVKWKKGQEGGDPTNISVLEEIANMVSLLRRIGKDKFEQEKLQRLIKVRNIQQTIIETAGGIDEARLKSYKEGTKADPGRIKSFIHGIESEILLPENRYDMLDGRANYKGAVHDFMWNDKIRNKAAMTKDLRVRYNNLLTFMKNNHIKMQDIMHEYRIGDLKFTTEEVMSMYSIINLESKANPNYEESIEILINGNGITLDLAQEFINKMNTEQPQMKRLADMLFDDYHKNKMRFNKVIQNLEGVYMGHETTIMPLVDRTILEGTSNIDSLAQIYYGKQLQGNREKAGLRTQRGTHQMQGASPKGRPYRLDMVNLWFDMVQRQEHYIHNAEMIRNWRDVFNSSEVEMAISSKYGSQFYKSFIKDIEDSSGKDITQSQLWLDKAMRYLQKGMGAAYLSLNPAPMLKQFPSINYYTKEAGVHRVLASMYRYVTDHKNFIQEMKDIDPLFDERVSERQIQREYSKFLKGRKAVIEGEINRTGFMGIRFFDEMAVSIGQHAIVQKELHKHGDIKKAVEEAQKITIRTQPSGDRTMLPQLYRHNEMLNLFFLMFTQQANKTFNQFYYTAPTQLLNKEIIPALRTFWAVGLTGMMLFGISGGFSDDPEDWWKSLYQFPISCLPIIGRILDAHFTGYNMVSDPLTDIVSESIGVVDGVVSDGEVDIDNLYEVIAILTHMPYSAGKRLYNVINEGDLTELLWSD